ncbi:MAG: hypothetical protein ABR927_16550 [Bacteroidales bacterium]
MKTLYLTTILVIIILFYNDGINMAFHPRLDRVVILTKLTSSIFVF